MHLRLRATFLLSLILENASFMRFNSPRYRLMFYASSRRSHHFGPLKFKCAPRKILCNLRVFCSTQCNVPSIEYWSSDFFQKSIRVAPISLYSHRKQVISPAIDSFTSISDANQQPEIFSFAPLMKHTHRHWRYFFRLLSTRSWVYTEMTAADNIVSRESSYIDEVLRFSQQEHPIALQLGGADPAALAAAARIAVFDYGYDAVNLNCGCPSPMVSGLHAAGAAHMLNSAHAARCCAAISSAVPGPPVTVKCRTGVTFAAEGNTASRRGLETYEELQAFVERVAEEGGVRHFVVHARAALLGVGTIENRHVPPLDRDSVARLASNLPHLSFVLNGALNSPADAAAILAAAGEGGAGRVRGVMVGRAIVNHPWAWASTDPLLHGLDAPPTAASRGAALAAYLDYAADQAAQRAAVRGGAGRDSEHERRVAAPVFNLFAGEACAAPWRRTLSKLLSRGAPAHRAIAAAAAALPPDVLLAPPGAAAATLPHYSRAAPTVGQLRATIS